jgi:hypothetical protein
MAELICNGQKDNASKGYQNKTRYFEPLCSHHTFFAIA